MKKLTIIISAFVILVAHHIIRCHQTTGALTRIRIVTPLSIAKLLLSDSSISSTKNNMSLPCDFLATISPFFIFFIKITSYNKQQATLLYEAICRIVYFYETLCSFIYLFFLYLLSPFFSSFKNNKSFSLIIYQNVIFFILQNQIIIK